jgi:soluble cytochrome b562
MSKDPKAELTDALTMGGPAVALHVLRHAINWSAETLSGLSQNPIDALDTAAMECVIALDDALAEVEALAAPLAALIEVAVTGAPVADYLTQQMTALTSLADRAAVARREREALSHVEERLRADAADHDRLTTSLDELRRHERLADALPELRAQEEQLAARMAEMRGPIRDAEQALAETARQVVTLSTERLADISEQTSALLTEIDQKEREWAGEVQEHGKLKAELAKNISRYETLKAERTEQVVALQEYCRVDGELMNSLPGSDGDVPDGQTLRRALDSVATTLRDVDDGLRAALARHDELLRQNRRLIGWNGQAAGTGGRSGGGDP